MLCLPRLGEAERQAVLGECVAWSDVDGKEALPEQAILALEAGAAAHHLLGTIDGTLVYAQGQPTGGSLEFVAMADRLPGELVDGPGLSAHLTQPVGAERLVVRYSPTLLLRRGIPWWLAHKYDMQLIDSNEQVIASLDQTPLRTDSPGRESYMVSVGGNMPGAFLELGLREAPPPFWRTLPLVLMGAGVW